MDGTRRWTWLALAVGALCAGCGRPADKDPDPSASDREARSELLRNLMASREKVPDAEAVQGASERQEPRYVAPEPLGEGGSGRPEPTGSLRGRVEWVGDDELLVRDAGGVERDLAVNTGTRLMMKGEQVDLNEVRQGDSVRVAYDEGPGGWVARQVEVLLPAPQEPLPGALPREARPPATPRR
ncbi:MAG TPA: hypothetical protein VE153_03305 [Myxococcus sp.]|nr:hypothetical protein [Myxococcus sp.]